MGYKLDDYMDWPRIEDLAYSECTCPQEVLGPLEVGEDVLVRCFFPGAKRVSVKVKGRARAIAMKAMDEHGYFAVFLGCRHIPEYSYTVVYADSSMEICDAYAAENFVDSMDGVMFDSGTHDTIYEKLGAHMDTVNGFRGTWFAVWAPNAISVSVVGDFNGWDGRKNPMRRLDNGIFELFVPFVKEGELYKYEIHGADAKIVLKADPYGYYHEKRPANASVVWDIDDYSWQDAEWMTERNKKNLKQEPVVIYEMQLGSFRRPICEEAGEEENVFYSYRELAPMVSSYCKEMGYTHVELMPVMEHPLDAS